MIYGNKPTKKEVKGIWNGLPKRIRLKLWLLKKRKGLK